MYPGAKGYEFFQYDSDRLGEVRNFATSPNIQIMVITVGAINKFGDEAAAAAEESDEAKRREKSKNKMYRASEKTGGERPIDLIRNTRPILIVDEPQSVDGGIDGKGNPATEGGKVHPRPNRPSGLVGGQAGPLQPGRTEHQPSRLRLAGELRHPLEPGSHHPAVRAH